MCPIHVFHKVRAVIALSLLIQPREIVSLTVKKLSSSGAKKVFPRCGSRVR
jgi:hypothetical protein